MYLSAQDPLLILHLLLFYWILIPTVYGTVVERRSFGAWAGEVSLSSARPAADE